MILSLFHSSDTAFKVKLYQCYESSSSISIFYGPWIWTFIMSAQQICHVLGCQVSCPGRGILIWQYIWWILLTYVRGIWNSRGTHNAYITHRKKVTLILKKTISWMLLLDNLYNSINCFFEILIDVVFFSVGKKILCGEIALLTSFHLYHRSCSNKTNDVSSHPIVILHQDRRWLLLTGNMFELHWLKYLVKYLNNAASYDFFILLSSSIVL